MPLKLQVVVFYIEILSFPLYKVHVMKKVVATLLAFFISVQSSFAISIHEIPNELSVTEHWISYTTSFDIETKTHKLGTLYRKFFSFLLTYEFFDPWDNKLAYAQARFFSLSAHFDVFDVENRPLGMAEEKIFTFFPTFDIYGPDGSAKLARAKMNFWGTTLTIYDPVTDQEMGVMHRSFFRLKNDWQITITNRPLFLERNIDPRLLLTVLAFQGDVEYWQNQNMQTNAKNEKRRAILDNASTDNEEHLLAGLKTKIEAAATAAGLDQTQKPEAYELESIATEIESEFNNTQPTEDRDQKPQDQILLFTNFCLNLVQSKDMPDEKKKAIIYLLKMRLNSTSHSVY